MSRSVLTLRSAVLIMHAVFYVPSVVAVPVLRPANASERAGHSGVTLTSEGTACWRARAKRDSERYGHGNGERVALGNFRSATAAAVTVAQWEHDHPCAAACSANSQVQASS